MTKTKTPHHPFNGSKVPARFAAAAPPPTMAAMISEVEFLTKAQAVAYLAKSAGNRRMRPNHVANLRARILGGFWRLSHQGISFDVNGVLIDGHHRLQAIAELPDGTPPVPIYVTRNCPVDAGMGIDQGIVRDAADILRIEKRYVEVARFIYMRCLAYNMKPAPESLRAVVDRMLPWAERLHEVVPSMRKNWSVVPMRAAVIVTGMLGRDFDYALGQYRAAVHQIYDQMNYGLQQMHRQVERKSLRVDDASLFFARALQVLDYGQANRRVFNVDSAGSLELLRSLFGDLVYHEPVNPADDREPAQRAMFGPAPILHKTTTEARH